MPIYKGYAHVFHYPDEDGKAYEQGDNIPIGKREVARLVALGHRFEGEPEPELETASVAVPPDAGSAIPLAEIADAAEVLHTATSGPHAPLQQPQQPTTAPVEPNPIAPPTLVFPRPAPPDDDTRRSTRRV